MNTYEIYQYLTPSGYLITITFCSLRWTKSPISNLSLYVQKCFRVIISCACFQGSGWSPQINFLFSLDAWEKQAQIMILENFLFCSIIQLSVLGHTPCEPMGEDRGPWAISLCLSKWIRRGAAGVQGRALEGESGDLGPRPLSATVTQVTVSKLLH